MRCICLRLKKCEDLYKALETEAKKHHIKAGVILSLVGCLKEARIRLAGGRDYFYRKEMYEIVSATGTISEMRQHIHISIADRDGNVLGGHMKEGCIVNTTCEVVIGLIENVVMEKEFDIETGYDEIKFSSEAEL